MALPQLGYKYVRALYPTDRAGILASRVGAELSPTSSISNSLSMYGSPFSASQTYSAFLPYSSDVSVLNHLLGYKYVRALYPTDRAGILASRVGAELSPTSSISNSLSMYGSPFSASQTYSAFLPYSSDVSVLNHL
ncbi:iroquois-class homeodomain protein IRX-3b, partial [Tachysurus ichikawai]